MSLLYSADTIILWWIFGDFFPFVLAVVMHYDAAQTMVSGIVAFAGGADRKRANPLADDRWIVSCEYYSSATIIFPY